MISYSFKKIQNYKWKYQNSSFLVEPICKFFPRNVPICYPRFCGLNISQEFWHLRQGKDTIRNKRMFMPSMKTGESYPNVKGNTFDFKFWILFGYVHTSRWEKVELFMCIGAATQPESSCDANIAYVDQLFHTHKAWHTATCCGVKKFFFVGKTNLFAFEVLWESCFWLGCGKAFRWKEKISHRILTWRLFPLSS